MPTVKAAWVVSTATHYAETTPPGSAAHQEVRQFQAEVFSHALRPGRNTYLETVDSAPYSTIPIAIRRQPSNVLVGTLRLEWPPETLIEAVVRFLPGSPILQKLAAGRIVEMGGFAVHPSLDQGEILDVLDVMAAALVELTEQKVDWLWLLPRRQLMRLLRANIPDLLPPYHFDLCRDVLEWQESSKRLRQLREMGAKGFYIGPQDTPAIYTISWQTLLHDLRQRMALYTARHQHPLLLPLLKQAMRQAQRQNLDELELFTRKDYRHGGAY